MQQRIVIIRAEMVFIFPLSFVYLFRVFKSGSGRDNCDISFGGEILKNLQFDPLPCLINRPGVGGALSCSTVGYLSKGTPHLVWQEACQTMIKNV